MAKKPNWEKLAAAARSGDGEAARQLGERYIRGAGIDVDERQAMDWFEMGYAAGNVVCRAWIGYLLLNAETLERNPDLGLEHIRAGAEAGVPFAKGTLYRIEEQRKRDELQARAAQMTSEERMRLALETQGVEDIEAILNLVRPSVRIRAGSAGGDGGLSPAPALRSSRLGGLPDLPPGSEWPVEEGQPMLFAGQINLADAARYDVTRRLPDSGLLSFFISQMPYERGKVLYFPEEVELVPWTTPPTKTFSPCGLHCFAEPTLPFVRTLEIDGLHLSEEEHSKYFDAYCLYQSELRPEPRGQKSVHRMLGHADGLQGDMRRQLACRAAGKDYEQFEPPMLEEARSRILLLQVASDSEAGMMWFDLGTLYFWIKEDDLLAKRFDRVEAMVQF